MTKPASYQRETHHLIYVVVLIFYTLIGKDNDLERKDLLPYRVSAFVKKY